MSILGEITVNMRDVATKERPEFRVLVGSPICMLVTTEGRLHQAGPLELAAEAGVEFGVPTKSCIVGFRCSFWLFEGYLDYLSDVKLLCEVDGEWADFRMQPDKSATCPLQPTYTIPAAAPKFSHAENAVLVADNQ